MVGWDNIRLTTLHRPEFQPLTGKTLAQAAELLGMEPVDCLCHVLAEEACNVTMIDFITCDEDIERILRAPFASVISDSLYPTEGLPHPRVYGTFTRILETFVRRAPCPDAAGGRAAHDLPSGAGSTPTGQGTHRRRDGR